MFSFLFGTICLILLVKVIFGGRRRRQHGRNRRCDNHSEGQPFKRRRRGRGGFVGAVREVFKRRLDLDEDQADIVDHAFRDLKDAGVEFKEAIKDSREDIVSAFAKDDVDDAALAAVFARHDDQLKTARKNIVSALKQVHAVLDPDQREAAADWLGTAEGSWS
ncbi:MAG: periplasmic heavy metal sensor [Proteobacteria bacterium]|nr:periplasmic heavy metal sensor [Pseudomonadota bacterium]